MSKHVWKVVYLDDDECSWELRYNGSLTVNIYCDGREVDVRTFSEPMSDDEYGSWCDGYLAMLDDEQGYV